VGDDRLCLSDNEVPMIVLKFQCSERILGILKRRTERVPKVSKVTVIERSEIDERPIWALRPELLKAYRISRSTSLSKVTDSDFLQALIVLYKTGVLSCSRANQGSLGKCCNASWTDDGTSQRGGEFANQPS
jgi:hypothetical protein